MTLDVAVFLFGVLVSILVGGGVIILFYGYAFAEQAKNEGVQLSPRMQRIVRFLLDEDAP